MKKIYLDSCIFIAYIDKNDSNNQHTKIKKLLDSIKERKDIKVYASFWAMTELIKVLRIEKKMSKSKVLQISQELIRKKRLDEIKIHWLSTPEKEYDLDEFFYDIQEKIIRYRIGVGDIIHIVIMELNKIDTILTFNDKDFSKFKEIKVIKPENFIRHEF